MSVLPDAAQREALRTAAERGGRPSALALSSGDGRGVRIESSWTEVAGVRVHAREALAAAPPQAPDVVLLHGLVVSGRYMVPLAFELAPDVRVHVPDLPGFGHTAAPGGPLGVRALGTALLDWIDARGLERPALVANSFGCQIAVEALVQRPGRLGRVVLQGPTFDPEAATSRQLLRWLRTGTHEPPSLNVLIARDYRDFGARPALATARDAMADDLRPKLPHVSSPTLVVRGTYDRLVTEQWARRCADALPDGDRIDLPGAAHALNYSAAPQLGALVRRFLGVPARRRRRPALPATDAIADFDSATAALRASSRALHGEALRAVGAMPEAATPLAERTVPAVNRLPRRLRDAVYRRGSGAEALPPELLHEVSAEALAEWMVGCHPRGRRYPGAIIGSSSGAMAHLAAALGMPLIPQTTLVPLQQPGVDPGDPRAGLRASRAPADLLLDANPELQLHHMHDPNQDRLTLDRAAYFRVKRRRLGQALERFLTESLPRGATIFVADCRLRWPVTRVGDRHVFQLGAHGGLDAEGFFQRWDAPAPDAEAPEAEWGFEPALLDDLRDLAGRRGLHLRRIAFDAPDDVSPLVADLHRWWYLRRGRTPRRLLVESFILLDPTWAMRTASVPLWLAFAVEPSAARLERYLAAAPSYDELRLTLFSHGTEGVGLAPIERWRGLLEKSGAPDAGFLGVDEERFPRDFASFVRFDRELRAIGADDDGAPAALTLEELDEFLDARGADADVEVEPLDRDLTR